MVCVRSFVPKLKNSASLRDLVRDERGARNLNHRPDQIIEFRLFLLRHFGGDAMHNLDLELQFTRITNQRNHDFGPHLFALLLHRGGGFKNGARLHLGNLRDKQSQAGNRGGRASD